MGKPGLSPFAARPRGSINVVLGADVCGCGDTGRWLPREAGFTVVCCSGGPKEVFSYCNALKPCVLIIDEEFLRRTDRTEFKRIADFGASVRVLVQLRRNDPQIGEDLLRLGCLGYLLPDLSPSTLRRAVRWVAAGELWAPRELISRMLREFLSARRRLGLTPREKEILALMAEGLKNREIAEALYISPETVRWHARTLYRKIGVHDRVRAAAFAREALEGEPEARGAA